jgi:hypothetical protein
MLRRGRLAAAFLVTGLLVPATAVAAPPTQETIWTSRGVSIYQENPCDPSEFIAAAWYVELDTVRRFTASGGLSLRATMTLLETPEGRPLWYWYGYRTTDPDSDPTLPAFGDPDYVYTLSGSARSRGPSRLCLAPCCCRAASP